MFAQVKGKYDMFDQEIGVSIATGHSTPPNGVYMNLNNVNLSSAIEKLHRQRPPTPHNQGVTNLFQPGNFAKNIPTGQAMIFEQEKTKLCKMHKVVQDIPNCAKYSGVRSYANVERSPN